MSSGEQPKERWFSNHRPKSTPEAPNLGEERRWVTLLRRLHS